MQLCNSHSRENTLFLRGLRAEYPLRDLQRGMRSICIKKNLNPRQFQGQAATIKLILLSLWRRKNPMIYLIVLVFVLTLLIFYTGGRRSGRKNLSDPSVDYKSLLNTHIHFYQNLDDDKKILFEKRIRNFLTYVHIEGVGTEITDTDRLLIASSAIIPVFGFEGWKYKNLSNVILYPDTFDEHFQFEGESRSIAGMVGTGYLNGQMILSRPSLARGFSDSSGSRNVGIHEFVHLLDKSDGETDGIPGNFMHHEYAIPWLKMIHQEMRRIEDGKSDIDPYAASNEAEFLTVASEYFFSKPEEFGKKHPKLYHQMKQIFGLEEEI